ncbi:MAG: hypothetical protein Q9183_003617, partial [Haloplaca sp. 2 TL-2023]
KFPRFRRKRIETLVVPKITQTVPQVPHQQHLTTLPSVAESQCNSTSLSTQNILPHSSAERRRQERPVELQSDPLGLNVIYQPPEGCRAVDIIFVHGLGGTSQKTWSRNKDLEFFWPREWLPFEPGFAQARMLSFGYNAHFAARGRDNILNIADFAKELLYGMKFGLDHQSQNNDVGKVSVPLSMVSHPRN